MFVFETDTPSYGQETVAPMSTGRAAEHPFAIVGPVKIKTGKQLQRVCVSLFVTMNSLYGTKF